MPLKIGNFIVFDMLNDGGCGGGVGEGVCGGGGVDGCCVHRKPVLSSRQHSLVRPVPLPRHHLKEVRSIGYIQDLISLYLCRVFHFA